MAEKKTGKKPGKKPGKKAGKKPDKKTDKAEVVVVERMGKPADEESFKVNPKRRDWVLRRIESLAQQVREAQLEIAAHLDEILKGEYHKAAGFDRFEDYVQEHLDIERSKAFALVRIHRRLVLEGGIKPEVLNQIGWWKGDIIARLPAEERSGNKLQQWVEDARSLNCGKLHARVKSTRDGREVETTERETFGFYPAQKENVTLALEIAKKVSGSEVKSHNLDMICAQFVASRAEEAGLSLKEQLDNLERAFDCKIVAFSENGEKVIYGQKVAKQYGIS